MGDVSTQTAYELRLHNCLHLLGIGLMYFDHLITLDDEISFLWKRAGSASAYWFFAVRYAGFAGNIPVTVFTFYTMPPKVVLVGAQLLVSIVMSLRVHALYRRTRRILILLGAVALPLLAVVLWSTQDQDSTPIDAFPGCHVRITQSTAYHLAAAWEALFAFDALIFALLLGKTYAAWGSVHLPIHTVMLKDGGLYFAAIALVNLLNILTFYLAGPILAGSLSTFASCMSVTLMARLMLNLHKKAGDGVLTDLHLSFADDDHEQSEIVFAQPRVSVASGTRARTQWGDSGLGLGMSMSMGMRRGDSGMRRQGEDLEMQRRGRGEG